MKIFSIFVKPANHAAFSATQRSGLLGLFTKDMDEMHEFIDYLENNNGIHKLKITNELYFYGCSSKEKVSIMATDTDLNPNSEWTLFGKINVSTSKKDLLHIIDHPDEAAQSNIEKLQIEIDKVKEIMISNVVKIQERGVKIESLRDKSEEIAKLSQQMRMKATELYRSQRCPTLFALFKPFRNLIWGKSECEYEYKPAEQSRPKN